MELTPVQVQLAAREKIFALEDELRAYPQVELPLVHRFAKGLYAREMFLPKGTIAVGKIHRHECITIVSQGDITLLTESGRQRFKAPYTAVSPAGTKRVALAHEDTILTTIHATDETDLEKLEDELILKNYDALPTQEEMGAIK